MRPEAIGRRGIPAWRLRRSATCLTVLLLCGYLASDVTAGEADQPTPPAGATKLDTLRSEELSIPAGDHRLAGTLYLPVSGPRVPAVVFVHGAGPAVRRGGYDELGRHFAAKGVAALIYDKRGCGASTGDWTRAGFYDLAEDALACVRLLRGRRDVNANQIGLWGLSQGAIIIPIAASRSPEVAFVIAVGGPLDFENQMHYFRANVFRREGLPPALLDIANKAFIVHVDLSNRIRSGKLPVPAAWRDAERMEFDLDQAAVWRQVRQPVLAIYGEKDRQVPVAENAAALTAAIKQSGNPDFTLVVYRGASHAIGKTQTGELGEEWGGYVPEYLDDMTDWVLGLASGAKSPQGLSRRGQVPESDQPFTARHYDRLRWYGSAPVQAIQFVGFALAFVVGSVAGPVSLFRGRRGSQSTGTVRPSGWLSSVTTAVSVLNLVLLVGLVVLERGLGNQWKPGYPVVLNWLPLVGSLSACLTLLLLGLLLARWHTPADSRRKQASRVVFATCTIAFVMFLHYWNLLGFSLDGYTRQ